MLVSRALETIFFALIFSTLAFGDDISLHNQQQTQLFLWERSAASGS